MFFLGRLHEIRFRWKNNLASKEGYMLRATTQFFDEVGVARINLDPRDWAEDLGVAQDVMLFSDCYYTNVSTLSLASTVANQNRQDFRYGEEYTPTAIDWRDYCQLWRFQCPFDFTWPLKSYGESAAINNLVRLSIKKDPEARNILRQAAGAHRQTAVASVMANDKAVWLFLEGIPLKVLQGPQAGEPWLTNEEMEKFKTLAARVYCEDYSTPRLSQLQPSEVPGTYSHLLDAEGRLYRGL
ncbi:hypothetical protein LTR17_022793 [Elasticomyces elasticus]|nr:hypothetical protein LTR17_022793 [Elasticomyces elasticus]